MRCAPAELGDHTGDMMQDRGQRGPGDLRDEDVPRLDVLEVVLVKHDAGRACSPPDSRRLSPEPGMPEPRVVPRPARLDAQRARLENMQTVVVLCPLDLDGRAGRRGQAFSMALTGSYLNLRPSNFSTVLMMPW